MQLTEWDALDKVLTGIVASTGDGPGDFELHKSNGRRKLGRPTRYTLLNTGRPRAPRFSAWSDADAIEKANAWIERHIGDVTNE